MDPTIASLIERMTLALGPPAATPEQVSIGNGQLKRAGYRVWRWQCPVCNGGGEDPQRIYRPLAVDSDGNVWCNQSRCTARSDRSRTHVPARGAQLLDALEAP